MVEKDIYLYSSGAEGFSAEIEKEMGNREREIEIEIDR